MNFENYQLDLTTPGIWPCSASSRKQMRHSLNLRRYARGRPQRSQRVYAREENFCGRFDFAIRDFFAIEPQMLDVSCLMLGGVFN